MKNLLLLYVILTMHFSLFSQTYKEVTKATDITNCGNARICWGDINNDNYLDLLIQGMDQGGNAFCKLYKNDQDTSFTEIVGAGLASIYQGSVMMFDYNNDNYLDIIITGKTLASVKQTFLYRNNKNSSFSQVLTPFENVSNGASDWADYDNDGDYDVIISGLNSSNKKITKLYECKDDDTFIEALTFPGICFGYCRFADFNNDGFPDIILGGSDHTATLISDIFLNNRNATFSPQNMNFPKLTNAEVAISDLNNDGALDIIFSGQDINSNFYSDVFKNNNNGTYFCMNSGLTPLTDSRIAVCDHDNDGFQDIAMVGSKIGNLRCARLYKNNSGNSFSSLTPFFDVNNGDLAFGDFDNDYDPDILISGTGLNGQETRLYRNRTNSSATVNQPSILNKLVDKNSINITWSQNDPTSDGYSYNFALGTTKNGIELSSPISNIMDGKNRLFAGGHLYTGKSLVIPYLDKGKYYFRIQAINQAYKSSLFSVVDSFVVCPQISVGNDTAICYGKNINKELGTSPEQVDWYNKLGLLLSNSYSLNKIMYANDTIWGRLRNSIGCDLRDTFTVLVHPLPILTLPSDTNVCKNSSLSVTSGTNSDTAYWSTLSGAELDKINSFSHHYSENDIIYLRLISKFSCVSFDTLNVHCLPLPFLNGQDEYFICKLDTVPIQLSNFDSVNWYSKNMELLKLNSLNFEYIAEQTDTLLTELFDQNQCTHLDTIYIISNSLPVADAGEDSTICNNTSITLGGAVVGSNGFEPYAYQWNQTSLLDDIGIEHPIATLNESVRFSLKITDANGCIGSDSVYITVNPKPVIDAGNDKEVCLYNSIELGGYPSALNSLFPFQYQWIDSLGNAFSNSENPEVFPNKSSNYTLIAQTYFCKPDTDYIHITVNPLPIVSAGKDVSIGYGESVMLEGDGGILFNWNPIEYIDNPESQNPFVNPVETTNYAALITDEKGCRNSDTVNIFVRNDIFVPTLFTPNQDGQNDVFKIYGTGIVELKLQILSKDGIVVYNSSDSNEIIQKGWDGSFQGNHQPNGAYVWMIQGIFANGNSIEYMGNKGVVYLLR